MSGALAKGKGSPLTPAQVQANTQAQAEAQKNSSFWFPIQQYFSTRLQQQAPGLKEQEKGVAGATAREQVQGLTQQKLAQDTDTGSKAGSSRYILDTGKGGIQAAAGSAVAGTQAAAGADRAYAQGLQQVVNAGQADQAVADKGLQVAANEQAQESGATTQAQGASAAGAGQVVGLVASLA